MPEPAAAALPEVVDRAVIPDQLARIHSQDSSNRLPRHQAPFSNRLEAGL